MGQAVKHMSPRGSQLFKSTTDIVVQTASMLHLQLVAQIAMYLPCGTRVGGMKVSGIAGISGWPPRTVANVEWS